MKKFLLLPLLLVLGLAASIVWFYSNVQPVSQKSEFKTFLITKGSSAVKIGANLEKAGLIRSALAFKIYTQFSGTSGRIVAGEFRLSPSLNLFQTVNELISGPVEIWVTIPEGLRREEIAERFAKGLDRDQSFISSFLEASGGEEGKLFPDTYLFPKEASASAIVKKMTRTFEAKTGEMDVAPGLSFEERIILASIIERETKTKDERPIVAGILINRLEAGMALQVDATVQYAVANSRCKSKASGCLWWEPLIREDLAINSPFNSYKFAGLPPSPISNPGLSSLQAAFMPSQTEYWYYIHDPEGQIHYARTLEEQNANVAKYLR
ncbi:MAG TPA: endolytic transglycosylase MltG [Patescibacteria group bacterium]|nr:endolytic transglycosylase MltG [Patescibacteria group bacterium]